MNYATIKPRDIANGAGVRVSLFVSGCTHHCKGCFNSEAWDFDYGKPFTEETVQYILDCLAPGFISGLTLLGGEPFEPENQKVLVSLLKTVRQEYPDKNVWCYTGYVLESELLSESRARCNVTDEMLSMIDILVDGRFVEEQKNISLRFRGSENQRIIDLKKTFETGKVVESN